MPEIKLPVSIYYHNNVFFEEIKQAQLPVNPYNALVKPPSAVNPYSAPIKAQPPVNNNKQFPPEAMSAPPIPLPQHD